MPAELIIISINIFIILFYFNFFHLDLTISTKSVKGTGMRGKGMDGDMCGEEDNNGESWTTHICIRTYSTLKEAGNNDHKLYNFAETNLILRQYLTMRQYHLMSAS